MRSTIALTLTALLFGGCASHSEDLQSVEISPAQYAAYDCAQLGSEIQRVADWEEYLKSEVDANAEHDELVVGFSIVLFPPALIFLEGDGKAADEYARLMGERKALQAAGVEKNCQLAQQ